MKPAAEDATEILVHYLRQVKSNVGFDPSDPDVFAEIEGVMQGLIDEESAAQKEDKIAKAKMLLRVKGDIEKLRIELAALRRELVTHKLPPDWTYAPGVQRVTLPPFTPDAPAPLGPMCVVSPDTLAVERGSFEHRALENFGRPGEEDADGDSR